MNYTLSPDARRPCIALVCDESGAPIEYPPGKYQKRFPFSYVPSQSEAAHRRAIESQFPRHEVRGISPRLNGDGRAVGRFEAKTTT